MWLKDERRASQVKTSLTCFVRSCGQRRDGPKRAVGDSSVARRREDALSEIAPDQRKVTFGDGEFVLRGRDRGGAWDTAPLQVWFQQRLQSLEMEGAIRCGGARLAVLSIDGYGGADRQREYP